MAFFSSSAASSSREAPTAEPSEVFDSIVAGAQNSLNSMDAGDKAALALGPVPILGDALGLVNDLRNFSSGRTELTPTNAAMSAMGVLPFVPSGFGIISRAPKDMAMRYEMLEGKMLERRGVKDFAELSDSDRIMLERESGGALRDGAGNIITNVDPPSGPTKLNLEYQIASKMRNDTPETVIGTKNFIDTETGKGYSLKAGAPIPGNLRNMYLDDFISGLPEIGGVKAAGIPVKHENMSSGNSGSFDTRDGTIGVATQLNSKDSTVRATVHHEYGHAVQTAQGLPNGANLETYLFKKGEKPTTGEANAAYNAYRRDAGEMHADAAAQYDIAFEGRAKEDRPTFGEFLEYYARHTAEDSGTEAPIGKSAALFAGIYPIDAGKK